MNGLTKVHNLNNTTDRIPPKGYATWRDWWEDRKGRKFDTCSCSDCTSAAEVGAHVQKHISTDRKWYIVPLCRRCNTKNSSESFYVRDYDLEPINK